MRILEDTPFLRVAFSVRSRSSSAFKSSSDMGFSYFVQRPYRYRSVVGFHATLGRPVRNAWAYSISLSANGPQMQWPKRTVECQGRRRLRAEWQAIGSATKHPLPPRLQFRAPAPGAP